MLPGRVVGFRAEVISALGAPSPRFSAPGLLWSTGSFSEHLLRVYLRSLTLLNLTQTSPLSLSWWTAISQKLGC